MNVDRAPSLVMWEVTRTCKPAYGHRRVDANRRRDRGELTTDEGFRLIDQVRALGPPSSPSATARAHPVQAGPPHFVLTGGDPMRRPDLVELVRYAAGAGLAVALTPGGTAAATPARLAALKDAGLSCVIASLDGPDPGTHDAFRGVRGSYAWTMGLIEATIDLGLPLQIHSTISRMTLAALHATAARVAQFPLTLWALVFLIRTGRSAGLEQISAEECERALNYLYDLSRTSPFEINAAEAPHYQRVLWQRDEERRRAGLAAAAVDRRPQWLAPRDVNDGNGFVFIDHLGNICPGGFLSVARGNVRTESLADVYRADEVFTRLRNANALLDKCGRCRFRAICGGSRARAFAATGAVMASDPLCAYEPGPCTEPLVTR